MFANYNLIFVKVGSGYYMYVGISIWSINYQFDMILVWTHKNTTHRREGIYYRSCKLLKHFQSTNKLFGPKYVNDS